MKSLFTSKTFWLAVLQAVAGGLAVLHPNPTVQATGALAITKSVVDVGLRILTTEPVTLGGK